MLLALDPGMCSPGVALFSANKLVAAGRVAVPVLKTPYEDGARWLYVAREIVQWFDLQRHPAQPWCEEVIFEKPQWYPQSKSKVDPNSLVGIAGVASVVVGILSTRVATPIVFSPTPREWIGQVSKVCLTCKGKAKKKCVDCHGSAWETPRGRLIRSRLSPAELALVPDQNDAIDAVGLGLFRLGRLAPRRVFSNGTD